VVKKGKDCCWLMLIGVTRADSPSTLDKSGHVCLGTMSTWSCVNDEYMVLC